MRDALDHFADQIALLGTTAQTAIVVVLLAVMAAIGLLFAREMDSR